MSAASSIRERMSRRPHLPICPVEPRGPPERNGRITVRNSGARGPVVRHPVAMTGRRGAESEGVPGDSGAADPPRGPEHRVAALTLAFLLVLGGLMGSINLFIDDVLREGPQRWLYGATMAACIAAAVPLVARQRVNRRPT